MSDRYLVQSVLGYRIAPGSTGGGGGHARPPSRSFAVLDRHVCYRIVAEFNTRPGMSEGVNARRARKLCDRLNELERV